MKWIIIQISWYQVDVGENSLLQHLINIIIGIDAKHVENIW